MRVQFSIHSLGLSHSCRRDITLKSTPKVRVVFVLRRQRQRRHGVRNECAVVRVGSVGSAGGVFVFSIETAIHPFCVRPQNAPSLYQTNKQTDEKKTNPTRRVSILVGIVSAANEWTARQHHPGLLWPVTDGWREISIISMCQFDVNCLRFGHRTEKDLATGESKRLCNSKYMKVFNPH